MTTPFVRFLSQPWRFALGVIVCIAIYAGSPSPISAAGISNTPVRKKVLVLIFDPVLESKANTPRLHTYMQWHDPEAQLNDLLTTMPGLSGNYLSYDLQEKIILDAYPPKDGFAYTDDSYLLCAANLGNPNPYCNKNLINYQTLIAQYDICAKNPDEVWMWGAPWFGFLEYERYGQSAGLNPCNSLTKFIMGFSYEHGVDDALHDFGHRMEFVLGQKLESGQWQQAETGVFNRFSKISNHCGNIHYPPGTYGVVPEYTYNYPDKNHPIQSDCESYLQYPTGPFTTQNHTCEAWGCTPRGYYEWWLKHIPAKTGVMFNTKPTTQLTYNNWWKYFVFFDESTSVPIGTISTPRVDLGDASAKIYGYTYSSYAGRFVADIATDAAMTSPVLNFGVSSSSPIINSNPTAKFPSYSCGTTYYVRVRVTTTNGTTLATSPVTSATVNCAFTQLSSQALLSSDTATFQFTPAVAAAPYIIRVGTTVGMSGSVTVGQTTDNSLTISSLANFPPLSVCGKTFYWQVENAASQRSAITGGKVNCYSYNTLSANLLLNRADFAFKYTGASGAVHSIELSDTDQFAPGGSTVVVGSRTASPITVTDLTSVSSFYGCDAGVGKRVYWRLRDQYGTVSASQSQVVSCVSFSGLSGKLDLTAAKFTFAATSSSSSPYVVDLSTSSTFPPTSTLSAAATGTSSPVTTTTLNWPLLSCGQKYYWRIRQDNAVSPVSSTTACNTFSGLSTPTTTPETTEFRFAHPLTATYTISAAATADFSSSVTVGVTTAKSMVVSDIMKQIPFVLCNTEFYWRIQSSTGATSTVSPVIISCPGFSGVSAKLTTPEARFNFTYNGTPSGDFHINMSDKADFSNVSSNIAVGPSSPLIRLDPSAYWGALAISNCGKRFYYRIYTSHGEFAQYSVVYKCVTYTNPTLVEFSPQKAQFTVSVDVADQYAIDLSDNPDPSAPGANIITNFAVNNTQKTGLLTFTTNTPLLVWQKLECGRQYYWVVNNRWGRWSTIQPFTVSCPGYSNVSASLTAAELRFSFTYNGTPSGDFHIDMSDKADFSNVSSNIAVGPGSPLVRTDPNLYWNVFVPANCGHTFYYRIYTPLSEYAQYDAVFQCQ